MEAHRIGVGKAKRIWSLIRVIIVNCVTDNSKLKLSARVDSFVQCHLKLFAALLNKV